MWSCAHLGSSHCIHTHIVHIYIVCGFGGAPWSMHYFYVSVRIFGIIEAQTATEAELQPQFQPQFQFSSASASMARSFWAKPRHTTPPPPLYSLTKTHRPLNTPLSPPRLLAQKLTLRACSSTGLGLSFSLFRPLHVLVVFCAPKE